MYYYLLKSLSLLNNSTRSPSLTNTVCHHAIDIGRRIIDHWLQFLQIYTTILSQNALISTHVHHFPHDGSPTVASLCERIETALQRQWIWSMIGASTFGLGVAVNPARATLSGTSFPLTNPK